MDGDAQTTTIAQIGDLHLGRRHLSARAEGGVNLRESDLYRASEALGDSLCELGPDAVVVCGDLFDSVNPQTRARSAAFRLCADLRAEDIPVVIVAGNHDHASGAAPSPLIHLAEFFGCELALTQCHFDVAGVRFHMLPYRSLARHAQGEPLEGFAIDRKRANVLVSHGYLSHPDLGAAPERVQLPGAIADDPAFAAVLLGHIHKRRQLGDRTFYSGPLERLTLGEIDADPGYWIHTFTGTELTATRGVALSALGAEGLPRQMEVLEVAQAGDGLDALHRRVLDTLRETDRAGAILAIRITDADLDVRDSGHPRSWQAEAHTLGAIACEVQIRSRPLEQALDAEMAPLPVKIEEGYRAFLLGADRPDLVDLAMTTIAEAAK